MRDQSQSFEGLDVAWLASDSEGHVAVFVTAGAGPIPELAFSGIEKAEEFALSLPKCSAYQLLVQVPDPSSFVALAERGLYVYDWPSPGQSRMASGAYRLAAVPNNPVQAASNEFGGHLSGCIIQLGSPPFGAQEYYVGV
jgi:hypothetical protein